MEFVTMYIVGNYLLTRIINRRHFNSYKNYKIIADFKDIYSCYNEMQTNCADIILIETDLFDYKEIELIKMLKNLMMQIKYY